MRSSGGSGPDQPDHARERLEEFIRRRAPQGPDNSITPTVTPESTDSPPPFEPHEEQPLDESDLPPEGK